MAQQPLQRKSAYSHVAHTHTYVFCISNGVSLFSYHFNIRFPAKEEKCSSFLTLADSQLFSCFSVL